ncbi:MAG: hypothetical protein ABGZ35_21540 [Planctomycetaceae bacterium]|jgi:hypothetical protein
MTRLLRGGVSESGLSGLAGVPRQILLRDSIFGMNDRLLHALATRPQTHPAICRSLLAFTDVE